MLNSLLLSTQMSNHLRSWL